jgi:hypothetical protein
MKKVLGVVLIALSLQGCLQYVSHTGYHETRGFERACRSSGGTPNHILGALGQPVVLKCKFD